MLTVNIIELTASEIIAELVRLDDSVMEAKVNAWDTIASYSRAVTTYQACALYILARQYNNDRANILEIGTAFGNSCSMIAAGAPRARIITLNPASWEASIARRNLERFRNITVVENTSWDYLERYVGPDLDMVFVDGNHAKIKRDLPWWNWIKPGGLFVHHDYSPAGSIRQCPPVYEALNNFGEWLGRDPDVLIIDDEAIGLAGWYKREEDPLWQTTVQPQS